jgi:GntR family transcriptional regulator, transcriptional repressor for pyruvate dehydrogenase complex
MPTTCTERILDLVAKLGLEKGDRLPGERDLAEQLAASRNTVREALVTLAARGQIEIRKRSGCYLISSKTPPRWHNLRADAESTMDALRAVGPHLAARTATHCQAEHIRRLETATARLGQHLVDRNATQLASDYVSFFAVLASLAGNPYLDLLMKEIVAARSQMTNAASLDKARAQSFFELHISLLQAIRTHDASRAQLLAAHGLDAFAAMLGHAPAPQTREQAS